MEIISNYLETIFLKLPNTPEIERAKRELGQMMEDKYHELLTEGKTENEAIGTVIAEFGNLDELAETLGIQGILDDGAGVDRQNQQGYQDGPQGYYQDGPQGYYQDGPQGYRQNNEYHSYDEPPKGHKDVKYGPYSRYGTSGNPYLDAFMSVFWSTITCLYLIWSFVTFDWWITWIIWPVAGVVHRILHTIFYEREG